MKYSINRRKFLELFGCGCCALALPSCSTVPITDRKQLTIFPEGRHEMLNETNKEEVYQLVFDWLEKKCTK